MIKIICNVIIITLISVNCLLSQTYIDSLLTQLKSTANEIDNNKLLRVRLDLYTKIAEYYKDNSVDDAFIYVKEALEICKKLGDNSTEAYLLNLNGLLYVFKGKPENALSLFVESLKISEDNNYYINSAQSLNYIGIVYWNLSDYDKALEYLTKSEKIYQDVGDEKGISRVLNTLSSIFYKKGEYDTALDYNQRIVKISEKLGDTRSLIATYNNMGLIYKSKKDYKNSEKYFRISLEAKIKTDNKPGIIMSYINIGELKIETGDINEAIHLLKKAENISAQISNTELLSFSYKGLADAYKSKANQVGQDSLRLYYDRAFNYLMKYDNYRDSLFSEQNNERIAELETKYKEVKKEHEIEKLTTENMRKNYELLKFRNFRNVVIIASFSLILIVMIIIRNSYVKKKYYQELHAKNNELTLTNEKLYLSEQSLKENNDAKDAFFSIIAHDLKNPFTALLGLSELLKMRMDVLEKRDLIESINIIHDSSSSLYKLIENLLQWSRTQTGRISSNPMFVSLTEIVENTFSVLKTNALKKEISMQMEIDKNMIIYADVNMITTVIRNLVSNAVKYTHKGGLIKVTAVNENDSTIIRVIDNGIGINPDDLSKLFKIGNHFTTKGTANETGTGLGLVLCYDFIRHIGGVLAVESEPGKGSTFTITIPRAQI